MRNSRVAARKMTAPASQGIRYMIRLYSSRTTELALCARLAPGDEVETVRAAADVADVGRVEVRGDQQVVVLGAIFEDAQARLGGLRRIAAVGCADLGFGDLNGIVD